MYPASDIVAAAIRQLTTTAGRRPIASEIHAQNNRPKIEIAPTQMIRNDASPGLILSTSTNKVVIHRLSPTLPVWLIPVRQAANMLRGYLNSSRHTVFSILPPAAGSWIVAGST